MAHLSKRSVTNLIQSHLVPQVHQDNLQKITGGAFCCEKHLCFNVFPASSEKVLKLNRFSFSQREIVAAVELNRPGTYFSTTVKQR